MAGVDTHAPNWRWLLTAYAWSAVCALVAFAAPVTSSNVSERTPSGTLLPPARETLFTHSHALIAVTAAAIVVTVAVGTVELAWRERTHRSGRGVASTIVAAGLIACSVLGLIFGALSLGVVGGCVLMSAGRAGADRPTTAMRTTPNAVR